MAKISIEIIGILRSTAKAIQTSQEYQWGHMGACNCGFLAQQVTRLTKSQIHGRALQGYGDWNEQLNDYCPTSGLLFDNIITTLLQAGFDIDDLKHLENLSAPDITARISGRVLARNKKDDVVLYLNTWAGLLEKELIESIAVTDLKQVLTEPVEGQKV